MLFQLVDGKPYCMELDGNLVPAVASSSYLSLHVHPFRINRLSFIVRVRNPTDPAQCRITVRPAVDVERGVVEVRTSVKAPLFLTLDEAIAHRAATIIVSGLDW